VCFVVGNGYLPRNRCINTFCFREIVKQNASCLPELLTTPTLEALLKVVERGNGESVKEIMEQTVIAVKEKKVDPTDILLRYHCSVPSNIAVLRIPDPGSDFFPSRIPDRTVSIPDPHQRI
jgi:hypothetical protein